MEDTDQRGKGEESGTKAMAQSMVMSGLGGGLAERRKAQPLLRFQIRRLRPTPPARELLLPCSLLRVPSVLPAAPRSRCSRPRSRPRQRRSRFLDLAGLGLGNFGVRFGGRVLTVSLLDVIRWRRRSPRSRTGFLVRRVGLVSPSRMSSSSVVWP